MKKFDALVAELSASAENICARASSTQLPQENGQGWSPAIILGHLVDVDNEVWIFRFKLLQKAYEDGLEPPQLKWWEPDPEATVQRYGNTDLTESMDLFRKSRIEMVKYLKEIPGDVRSASAVHATFGLITIETMLQIILDHDFEHLGSLN